MGRRATPAAAGVFILAALLLAGCAAPQVSALVARPPADLPAAAEIASVPFYAQEDYQCGPASLAAVLPHRGGDATAESLVPQVYVPARKGSLQAEMLAAARRHGLVAFQLAPRRPAIVRRGGPGQPRAGRPT